MRVNDDLVGGRMRHLYYYNYFFFLLQILDWREIFMCQTTIGEGKEKVSRSLESCTHAWCMEWCRRHACMVLKWPDYALQHMQTKSGRPCLADKRASFSGAPFVSERAFLLVWMISKLIKFSLFKPVISNACAHMHRCRPKEYWGNPQRNVFKPKNCAHV